ncbi:MAG: hypothetical protein HYZ53_24845 [Planctomycetes bacterium]|nr:hypothetical protein [Planctomycetota bacterium]
MIEEGFVPPYGRGNTPMQCTFTHRRRNVSWRGAASATFLRISSPGRPVSAASGFTLLEAMLAAVVILVALMGLASTMSYAARTDMVAGEHMSALNAGRAEMETIKATSFGALAALNNTNFTVAGMSGLTPVGQVLVNTTNPNLFDVTVTVTWRGVMGPQTLTLRTLIANQ